MRHEGRDDCQGIYDTGMHIIMVGTGTLTHSKALLDDRT